MPTISFQPGFTGPFALEITDAEGNALDLAATQIRIPTGTACLTINGTQDGTRWHFDFDNIGLNPRLYTAAFYYDEGDGWRQLLGGDDLLINIIGGC